MMALSGHSAVLALAVVSAAMFLSACSTQRSGRAPVEDRGTAVGAPVPVAVDLGAGSPRPLPGLENAGLPGYYTVKSGDTLIRIGLDTGQNWRDVARWNNLENPNVIEVGQVLRVAPPTLSTAAVARPVASPVVSSTVVTAAAASAPTPAAAASGSTVATTAAPAVTATGPAATADDDLSWIWPARGAVLTGFDETRNKGLDIGGAAGDAVLAAADGRVVYVGASLRGYGNLVILKHNNTYLTAYAHNQVLLVKEDQSVRKGQKIAEMGSSDADRVKLHFEVRRQGKPVDPAKYLPPR